MSLIPRYLIGNWWDLDRPSRIFDQHFGQVLEPQRMMRDFNRELQDLERSLLSSNYYRPWSGLLKDEGQGYSTVKCDKEKFQVSLDVQQFKPEEINVKVVDNCILIEGKHEEKQDEHGYISRQFTRRYMVPDQCDPDKTVSALSSDGVLTISCPRKPEALEDKKEKVISIEHTGKPAIEKKK